jgi:sulfide:quinone oxidoreductase
VYAIGDLAALPMAKAGVFAEAAARVVADDIAATLHGTELEQPYEGAGNCFIEFGGGMVGKVEANFLGGPKPTARLVGPSRELAAEKEAFGAVRRERWFGG